MVEHPRAKQASLTEALLSTLSVGALLVYSSDSWLKHNYSIKGGTAVSFRGACSKPTAAVRETTSGGAEPSAEPMRVIEVLAPCCEGGMTVSAPAVFYRGRLIL